jgi:hypothetical protein
LWGMLRVNGNKKVKNATKVEFNGVKFDSKLECYFYKALVANNIVFELKPSFTLIPKFRYLSEAVRACTYTPDFIIRGKRVIVDTKGFKTDIFNLKLKMLKKYFSDNGMEYIIELPRNQKQCNELIEKLR